MLQDFLEAVTLSETVKPSVDDIASELKRGLAWPRVIPIIEKIRDVLMRCYMEIDLEFGQYLLSVNKELQVVYQNLNTVSGLDQSQRDALEIYQAAVSDQVEKIRDSVETSDTLAILKKNVTNHISKIGEALAVFQESQQQSHSISDQLNALIEQVRHIERESQDTKEMLEQERYKATHDPLTGLANRSAYTQRADHEFSRFKRYGEPLSLCVADIDHFKQFNDTYGHQTGDNVLKVVANSLKKRFREIDFVARYGGEEFVILMPSTEARDALPVLNEVREAIAGLSLRFDDKPVQVTMSFGLTQFKQSDTVTTSFERADAALYQAKKEGRNRCCAK